jgi:hypothetical protein
VEGTVDIMQVAANVAAYRQTHREYVQYVVYAVARGRGWSTRSFAYIRGMALRGRPSGSDEALQVYSTGRGLVVQGSTTDVTLFIDTMMALTSSSGGKGRHLIVKGTVDVMQVAANVAAYRQTHREYFEFSQRALDLLKQHGTIPTDGGFFRSVVRNGREFAGNLDWKPVDLSPEQALGLQAMAGQMALRAAIKDVIAAIERVENKVDKIAAVVRAERLGAALGNRATLHPLVERMSRTGELSDTDWGTIATLGPSMLQDIESLRSYVVLQFRNVGNSAMMRNRAADAEDLTDHLLRESIALLVVAEQNYALWQELRMGRAALHERSALRSITSDVHQQLAALTRADQALVDQLSEVITRLTASTGYEGLAPLKKRKLKEHAEDLTQLMTWFGDQRHLDYDVAELQEYPRFSDSLSKVRRVISTTLRSISDGDKSAVPSVDVEELPTSAAPDTEGGDR